MTGRGEHTIEKYGFLCRGHITADLGARKLRELPAADVDRWLAAKAAILSSSTVQRLHACLNRIIIRAMARDQVKRNVVALCGVSRGKAFGTVLNARPESPDRYGAGAFSHLYPARSNGCR